MGTGMRQHQEPRMNWSQRTLDVEKNNKYVIISANLFGELVLGGNWMDTGACGPKNRGDLIKYNDMNERR